MPQIKVYGASDDLIEIEGYITDEFNVYAFPVAVWLIAPNNEHVILRVNYDRPSIPFEVDWTIMVKSNESKWPVEYGIYGYSDYVLIDVPEGTIAMTTGKMMEEA